jgi:predicted dehydrogenase
VGIVGLSASGGWAAGAHVPALRHLPGFELTALSASSLASARAAGETFGVATVFDDVQAMAECDEVDMVVVTVKVPHHRELVAPALRAGKIVLCEWPLALDVAEAAALANDAKTPAFVGLQARSAPTIRFLIDLITDGYIGTVLSTTMVGSGGSWGETTDSRNAYTLDRATGATMLTIPFGHAVDALAAVLGEFETLQATMATRRPQVREAGTDSWLPMTAADQIAVIGRLSGGAVASVHYRGGVCRGTNFYWEINGTEGDLVLTADRTGHIQLESLLLRGSQRGSDLAELSIPDRYRTVDAAFAGTNPRAYNVACQYAQILADLREGTQIAPTFADAVVRHQVLAEVESVAG